MLADELFLLEPRLLFNVILLDGSLNLFETLRRLLRLPVLQQRRAQLLADFFVVSRDEVVVELVRHRRSLAMRLVLHRLWTAETRLHGKDIGQVTAKVAPDGDARSLLLGAASGEPRVVI